MNPSPALALVMCPVIGVSRVRAAQLATEPSSLGTRPTPMRRRGTFTLFIAMTALLLSSCGFAGVGAGSSAHVSGQVLLGPSCPVETAESPCPPTPLSGAKVEIVQDGKVTSSGETDGQGEFTLDAPTGTVTVRAETTEGLPSETSQTVDLQEDQTATVTLTLDSGIR